MWPWEHAAVGYLALSALTLLVWRRWPIRNETVVLVVATQLPDLVDKPLAWTFGLLPTGRSLAHSLLTAAVLVAVASVLVARYDRRALAGVFGVGYLSHLLADLPAAVVGGDLSGATYLLWPVLQSPVYQTEPSFAAHVSGIAVTDAFVLQALGAVAVGAIAMRNLVVERAPE